MRGLVTFGPIWPEAGHIVPSLVANVRASTHIHSSFGPIVKWYYAAFALRRRESDSPWVHIKVNEIENVGRIRIAEAGVRFSLGPHPCLLYLNKVHKRLLKVGKPIEIRFIQL